MIEHEEFLTRLGLRTAHCGDDSWVHNGGWYDKTGVKVGWGDLGKAEIPRIKKNLKDGEVLFVLSEGDSYFNFIDYQSWKFKEGTDPGKPGIDYVIQKFRFYITNQGVFRAIDRHALAREGETLVERSQVKKLLGLK